MKVLATDRPSREGYLAARSALVRCVASRYPEEMDSVRLSMSLLGASATPPNFESRWVYHAHVFRTAALVCSHARRPDSTAVHLALIHSIPEVKGKEAWFKSSHALRHTRLTHAILNKWSDAKNLDALCSELSLSPSKSILRDTGPAQFDLCLVTTVRMADKYDNLHYVHLNPKKQVVRAYLSELRRSGPPLVKFCIPDLAFPFMSLLRLQIRRLNK